MKRILVPTDFSTYADCAFETAVQWAKHYGAALKLFHSISPQDHIDHLEGQALLYEVAQQKLEAMAAVHPDLQIHTKMDTGLFLEAFAEEVATDNPDMVIMGSHGKVGWNELLVSSNTQKAVRAIHCPVLVVKNEVPIVPFRKMIYASSFNVEEQMAFQKWIELVKPDEPEIILVHIKNSVLFQAPETAVLSAMKDYAALAAPLACQTVIYAHDHIKKSIRAFAEDHQADAIVLSNHKRKPLKRLFKGSTVEALINQSTLPIWSIDY